MVATSLQIVLSEIILAITSAVLLVTGIILVIAHDSKFVKSRSRILLVMEWIGLFANTFSTFEDNYVTNYNCMIGLLIWKTIPSKSNRCDRRSMSPPLLYISLPQ